MGLPVTSMSTTIAGLPFSGPIGGTRVALIGDQWVGFPTVAQLEDGPAGLLIGAANGIDGLSVRDTECGEPRRVEQHLILLHHSADARHLRNAGQRFQFIT